MPPGVINMLPGDGLDVSKVALAHPDLAGIHFTGSTPTFQHLWQTVGDQHRRLPLLPAHRRRDRRQGLHRRAPLGRPRRAARRDDPRRVRVPGPEVLGRLARLRAQEPVGQDQGPARRRHRERSRWATSPTSPTSWAPSSTTAPSPSTRRRSRGPSATKRPRGRRRRPDRRLGRLVRAPDDRRPRPTRPTRCSRPSTSARSSPSTSTTTRDFEQVVRQMEDIAPYALTGAVIAQDRARDRLGQRGAALRGRQLLRQRQAHRRRRRPAALRRRSGLGHQRQGRRRGQPAALDLAALDQGDVRARRPSTATRTRAERPRIEHDAPAPSSRTRSGATSGSSSDSRSPSVRRSRRAPGSRCSPRRRRRRTCRGRAR